MRNCFLLGLLFLLIFPACHEDDTKVPGSPVVPDLKTDPISLQSSENGLDIDVKSKSDSRTNEELVIQNCYVVHDAVEQWAIESGGAYPYSISEESPLGNTLIDLLPRGELLSNPFTGVKT